MAPRMHPDRTAALRAERRELLRFCSGLKPADWSSPSAAEGWRVQDVVAHIGAGCHSLFTPSAATMVFSKDIERTNDTMVQARRSWAPAKVIDEYTRWSAWLTRLSGGVAATPVRRLHLPLAELGSFPLGLLLGGAMVFDHHTHLRFDMAPALGRPAPPTDANRMAVVIEWMLAVLSNQLRSSPPEWLHAPLNLELTGPGGGTWSITPDGTIAPAAASDASVAVVATAEGFPEWATQRSAWRDGDVSLRGDVEHGERFLDLVNVV